VADRYGYAVRFLPVGPEPESGCGAPTQMAVFTRASARPGVPAGFGQQGRPA
jgi:hypothetical protein